MQDQLVTEASFYTVHSYATDELQPGRVDGEQVKQTIRNIAESILRDIPKRLLNTRDGKMYADQALKKKFEESEIFRSLIILITTESVLEQKQFIIEVVRNFFAYVMLSHRWEDDELAFDEIKGQSVYDLPASRFQKVRGFCRQAATQGFDWAWVDTCCIDQKSSADVSESIRSMFSWYRGSALTIIYLSDVATSNIQALLYSQWFRRGWTLQELLAANVIQIYKEDWSLFSRAAFNHKVVPELLAALQSATGIEQRYLVSYSPRVEQPRLKLRWAHHRATKKKEDEGYCLMGIFGFTLSVRYGESDKAFSRLLVEIMRHTDDATLLDWVGQSSSMNSYLPASPRCFSDAPFEIVDEAFHRSTLSFAFVAKLVCVLVGATRRARNAPFGMLDEAFHRSTMSFPFVAKLIWVLKGATRRARNSSHPHGGQISRQESGGGGSSMARAPQLPKLRSNQNLSLLNRAASFPFEESELSLAELLERPPKPYILTPQIHITVPCFVHKVQSLFFDPNKNAYVCHANGIQQLSFVTFEKLRICTSHHHSPSDYLLARPWDPRLCYDSSNTHHNSLLLLRQRLASPFFVMLLEPSNDGRFRRISTGERIVAKLDPPQAPSPKYGVRFLDLQ